MDRVREEAPNGARPPLRSAERATPRPAEPETLRPVEPETAPDAFSPLELRDRVVIMAIFYEIVQVAQVEAAWHTWNARRQQGEAEALWRVLVEDPALAREAVFEVAAQIYGFEEAEINRLRALALINDLAETFTQQQWQQMIELLVIPIGVGEDPRSGEARLVFATHDPTRPEVARLLQGFQLNSFELKYAAAEIVTDLFTEAFQPQRRGHPLSGQDAWGAHDAPDAAARPEAELDPSSLVEWFESVLVAAYRAGAAEAHIFLNADRHLEIHFSHAGGFRLWRKEDTLHPEGLLAYVMDDILNVDDFEPGVGMEVNFQRWIDRDLTRFHLSIRPAPESEALDKATVVLRLLGHRETSAEGMGPWKSH